MPPHIYQEGKPGVCRVCGWAALSTVHIMVSDSDPLIKSVERLVHGMLGGSSSHDLVTQCDAIYAAIAAMPISQKWSFFDDLREEVKKHLP